MTFAVTSYPTLTNGIRTLQLTEHEIKAEAEAEAERVILAGNTEVRVWRLVATPAITRTVSWTTPSV